MKALETIYRGYRFRSRLEARWAVFFDTLGVRYDYEPEGFDLGDGLCYLPDFWLSSVRMWAEVKALPFTEEEATKAKRLARASGYPVLRLVGPPRPIAYWADEPRPGEWSNDEEDLMDYLLTDQYIDDEHRFYHQPNLAPEEEQEWLSLKTEAAYAAARGARFWEP